MSGTAPRIVHNVTGTEVDLKPVRVLTDGDGYLYVRYVRR